MAYSDSFSITTFADSTDDILSPGIRHGITNTVRSVNFGKLIKPTPFQTYSTSVPTLIDPSSQVPTADQNQSVETSPLASSSDDNLGSRDRSYENKRSDRVPKFGGRVKQAKKSWFYREKQLGQSHDVMCGAQTNGMSSG